MAGPKKKVYMDLNGKPVLLRSLEPFLEPPQYSPVIITVPVNGIGDAAGLLSGFVDVSKLLFVEGGGTRQESVFIALKSLSEASPDYVLIHDAARPWITRLLVDAVAAITEKYGACIPVIRSTDAMKELDKNGFVRAHLSHESMACAQTPQGFGFGPILDAHERAAGEGVIASDDAELYQRYHGRVATVPGDPRNRKITFPFDLYFSEVNTRVGFGYDIHRLVPGRKLVLGGVIIPFPKGEEGYSDGDVLAHALIDALLGAASMGDIGTHFPQGDPRFKDVSSRTLLRKTREMLESESWTLINCDCTVILEEPRLAPHIASIKALISEDLGLNPACVSVKAKTKERLDSSGKGEGIEAYAVALLDRERSHS